MEAQKAPSVNITKIKLFSTKLFSKVSSVFSTHFPPNLSSTGLTDDRLKFCFYFKGVLDLTYILWANL